MDGYDPKKNSTSANKWNLKWERKEVVAQKNDIIKSNS